jgi:hypothetical protein
MSFMNSLALQGKGNKTPGEPGACFNLNQITKDSLYNTGQFKAAFTYFFILYCFYDRFRTKYQ